jgi:hypothetical protein
MNFLGPRWRAAGEGPPRNNVLGSRGQDDNEKESRTALTVLSQQRPGARPANPLQCHCAIFTRILTAIHKAKKYKRGQPKTLVDINFFTARIIMSNG